MKVNVKDSNYFDESKRLNLKKVAKRGFMLASTLLVVSSSIGGCGIENKHDDELNSMVSYLDTNVSLDEVNDMNIIINDSDCSDTFFEDVCAKLSDDGLIFTVSRNNENINKDNSTVVTLDHQYSSGSDTIIFAPYNNTTVGNSDSLALSMQAAFKQNGFLGNNIVCGKVGYREDENGNIVTSIPTETEEALDADSDTSFVTISFGTQNTNSEWVAKSIENGLARQRYYLNNYDTGSDLVYRASSTDDVEVIADYFNSDVNTLNRFNNIDSNTLFDSQAIINPEVEKMDVFNQNSKLSIGNVKTRAY